MMYALNFPALTAVETDLSLPVHCIMVDKQAHAC